MILLLLTVPVTHNSNIINDISTRSWALLSYFADSVSVSRFLSVFRGNQSLILHLFSVLVAVFFLA